MILFQSQIFIIFLSILTTSLNYIYLLLFQSLKFISYITLNIKLQQPCKNTQEKQSIYTPMNYMIEQYIEDDNYSQANNSVLSEEQTVREACQICYIRYQKTNKDLLRPALVCYECWYQHVKANLTKISYMVGANIISPFEGGDDIDVCIALNGLNQDHKVELQQWLFKKYTTFTKDIQKCPSQVCDYVFTAQKCNWIIKEDNKCPKCQISLTVAHNFTIKNVLGFIYFIFLANKCPKCEIPIERISGCPHMTCPCGHQFCWFCLKDHALRENNLYSIHEPKECASIFLSKIIIFVSCLLSLSCFLVGGQTIREIMQSIFNILGYIIHSVIIDFCIFLQWMVANIYRNQPFRNLPFQRSPTYVKMIMLGLVNLALVGVLIIFDLFYTTLGILFIEVSIFGAGALIVFTVIFSCETWFEFVA